MERLLKTQDLCERWQCSTDTVLGHIPKGLKVIPLGSKEYRYALNDVIEYEEHLKSTMDSYNKLNSINQLNKFKAQKVKSKFQIV